jgi:hypothetical protein
MDSYEGDSTKVAHPTKAKRRLATDFDDCGLETGANGLSPAGSSPSCAQRHQRSIRQRLSTNQQPSEGASQKAPGLACVEEVCSTIRAPRPATHHLTADDLPDAPAELDAPDASVLDTSTSGRWAARPACTPRASVAPPPSPFAHPAAGAPVSDAQLASFAAAQPAHGAGEREPTTPRCVCVQILGHQPPPKSNAAQGPEGLMQGLRQGLMHHAHTCTHANTHHPSDSCTHTLMHTHSTPP